MLLDKKWRRRRRALQRNGRKETRSGKKKERTRALMSFVALSVLNVLKCILGYPAPQVNFSCFSAVKMF